MLRQMGKKGEESGVTSALIFCSAKKTTLIMKENQSGEMDQGKESEGGRVLNVIFRALSLLNFKKEGALIDM